MITEHVLPLGKQAPAKGSTQTKTLEICWFWHVSHARKVSLKFYPNMKSKTDTNKHLAVGMHSNHPSWWMVFQCGIFLFFFLPEEGFFKCFGGEETISNEREREKSSINRELVCKVVAHKITMNNTHCKTNIADAT